MKKKRKKEYGDLKLKVRETCLHAPPLAEGGRERVRGEEEGVLLVHFFGSPRINLVDGQR
jgi:hypothetical protein